MWGVRDTGERYRPVNLAQYRIRRKPRLNDLTHRRGQRGAGDDRVNKVIGPISAQVASGPDATLARLGGAAPTPLHP
jgi:hypothetical protein